LKETGYTLVELAVVIALLGIFLAIGLPILDAPLASFVLDEAAWRLARDLRQIQHLAIMQEEWFKVEFQHPLDRYVISRSGEIWAIVDLPPGVEMNLTSFRHNQLFFYPSGAPSMGGTIPLTHRRGGERYVKVTVGAGRVRVTGEGESE
jgi:prepilin-type N-terminal cleavage/methylation domain-containing protein